MAWAEVVRRGRQAGGGHQKKSTVHGLLRDLRLGRGALLAVCHCFNPCPYQYKQIHMYIPAQEEKGTDPGAESTTGRGEGTVESHENTLVNSASLVLSSSGATFVSIVVCHWCKIYFCAILHVAQRKR